MRAGLLHLDEKDSSFSGAINCYKIPTSPRQLMTVFYLAVTTLTGPNPIMMPEIQNTKF